jgi:hypothetical protein
MNKKAIALLAATFYSVLVLCVAVAPIENTFAKSSHCNPTTEKTHLTCCDLAFDALQHDAGFASGEQLETIQTDDAAAAPLELIIGQSDNRVRNCNTDPPPTESPHLQIKKTIVLIR